MTFRATPNGSVRQPGRMSNAGQLVLGPEVLVNGDFNAGAASWVVSGNDATHIATFSGTSCQYQTDTTTPALLVQQLAVLTVGKLYQITLVITANATGGLLKTDQLVQQLSGSALVFPVGPGTYTLYGRAVSTAFGFTRTVANMDITLDSISIKQVLP